MPGTPPRTRLEQRMRAARLSQRDVLRRFPEEASSLGEGEVYVSERQLKRWLAGGAPTPRTVSCRVLEAWFGEPVERLLGPPEEMIAPDPEGGDAVVEAGRRAVEHAIEAASALDDSALEHLRAAAGQAAHAYLSTPPLEMLTALVSLRETIYAQLDRTHKPRQQSELYLLAGQVCGLLSSVSFDLGNPVVAEELARAAHTYGSVIDHPSLCAWARALQANMQLWSGRPRETMRTVAAALPRAPLGTARARLLSVRARAVAQLGGREEASRDLMHAGSELDRSGSDPLMDVIGGEMGFGRARHALCVGAANVALGDGPRAESAARSALALFTAAEPSDRWEAGELACHADLAAACLMNNDEDGIRDTLRVILTSSPASRTEAVAVRMLALESRLELRGLSRSAGDIAESVRAFCRERDSYALTAGHRSPAGARSDSAPVLRARPTPTR